MMKPLCHCVACLSDFDYAEQLKVQIGERVWHDPPMVKKLQFQVDDVTINRFLNRHVITTETEIHIP